MSHSHDVIDTNTHFIINPLTRKITSAETTPLSLMQYDHNSERLTFEMPRYIDGHDMTLCNKIEVHYINITKNKTQQNADIYRVDDISVGEGETEEKALFSWLVSQNATKLVGSVMFSICFLCTTEEIIDYSWATDIHTFSIAEGIRNTDAVVAQYADAIEAIKDGIRAEIRAEAEEKNLFFLGEKTVTAENGIIALTDISPLPSAVSVSVSESAKIHVCGKNLIPFPYLNMRGAIGKVNFQANEMGVITLITPDIPKGGAANLCNLTLPSGKYKLHGMPKDMYVSEDIRFAGLFITIYKSFADRTVIANYHDIGSGVEFTLNEPCFAVVCIGACPNLLANTTYEIKPMLSVIDGEFETPTADNFVTGNSATFDSISPTMTIYNESGLPMEVTYKVGYGLVDGVVEALKQTNAIREQIESGELDGKDGYTPQKGVDYWTEADKAEIKGYVDEAILGGEW